MKYEIIHENGAYRIRALRDIPMHGVKDGDLGGYVPSYSFENLSQDGECWIGTKATVMHQGIVSGNALLKDTALIGHRARVYDNAVIGGYAVIGDDAQVYGNAAVMDDATVRDHSQVFGYAVLRGSGSLWGNSRMAESIFIEDGDHTDL